MESNRTSAKMPEILVFVRALVLGFVLAEIFRIAYVGGCSLRSIAAHFDPVLNLAVSGIAATLLVCYVVSRQFVDKLVLFIRSQRVDLLLSLALGIWASDILSPLTLKLHEQVGKASPLWTLLIGTFLLVMIASSLTRSLLARRRGLPDQMFFLGDDEIQDAVDDVLANQEQAIHFAQTVLASGSNSCLVYGIDAPWGTGKTSFINLAWNYWRLNAAKEVIVFKFEALRYATDPDLAERLLRDLSAEIQKKVFVPEFRPVATRYSRMLKGKADFSFLGFKLSLEPSGETIDELLEDIDEVLRRIRRRLIVVIDDLDRLEPKAVSNVLFTVRRTFKLTQTTYILCYDTENLLGAIGEGEQARQFLEKFVSIKLSLFVDSSTLIRFLRREWSRDEDKYQSIPSDTMLKLASVLSELANMLEGEHAAKYMLLIGDMRKLKRFVNAVLMMQIEKTNLARTDFHRGDLINLMLLHLNYPGIFRQIYSEETENRSGIFSIRTAGDSGSRKYANADGYTTFVEAYKASDGFLLNQLFGSESLGLDAYGSVGESVRASRACFNTEPDRNLEKYLKLIVRVATPEPRDTFRLYQDAVAKIVGGATVKSVLSESEFDLAHGEHAHDQFWRILVSQSHQFRSATAEDSINTLVDYLPRYSSIEIADRGLRARSIYDLIRLLDRAGWGHTRGQRKINTPENVIEIAYRIFGEAQYQDHGLIDRLGDASRGVLGLGDLMLFRLQCSADRQGQIYNVHTALIVHDDMKAPTSGLVQKMAISGMRTISQRVFALFKSRYIDTKRNLFDDVDAISDAEFVGAAYSEAATNWAGEQLRDLIDRSRSLTKSFIVFQLVNRQPGTGLGVGCGYYDVTGNADGGEIARQMNEYIFEVCFNPELKEQNGIHFLDYCLRNFSSGVGFEDDEDRYIPTAQSLVGELIEDLLADFWARHGTAIKEKGFATHSRRVITFNYLATYAEELPRVFDVLDGIRSKYESAHKEQGGT